MFLIRFFFSMSLWFSLRISFCLGFTRRFFSSMTFLPDWTAFRIASLLPIEALSLFQNTEKLGISFSFFLSFFAMVPVRFYFLFRIFFPKPSLEKRFFFFQKRRFFRSFWRLFFSLLLSQVDFFYDSDRIWYSGEKEYPFSPDILRTEFSPKRISSRRFYRRRFTTIFGFFDHPSFYPFFFLFRKKRQKKIGFFFFFLFFLRIYTRGFPGFLFFSMFLFL